MDEVISYFRISLELAKKRYFSGKIMTLIQKTSNLSESRKYQLYWLTQCFGWLAYVILIWLINRLGDSDTNAIFYYNLLTTYLLGIFFSHLYRLLILKRNWLLLSIPAIVPRIIIASFVFGLLYYLVHSFLGELMQSGILESVTPLTALFSVLNLAVNFTLWSLLYFLFHFIQNYRQEEIKNLRWQAHSREVELNRLKSQMNPHFIFNAMNTIRALVDENPKKSKEAITQLSNILRSSMMMGRNKVIPLFEEMQLVRDYLNIEKVRFEERLQIEIDIPESLERHLVPPLIIQTLVENSIKHGISKLPQGGKLKLSVEKNDNGIRVLIENDGTIQQDENKAKGFGIINSQERLKLLYGDRASLSIKELSINKVQAVLEIPKKPKKYFLDLNKN